MRDASQREYELLADLRGDLCQTPQEYWTQLIRGYEADTGVLLFVEPVMDINRGAKKFGHSIGVVNTYPRDHLTIYDSEQNNWRREGERVVWRQPEPPIG